MNIRDVITSWQTVGSNQYKNGLCLGEKVLETHSTDLESHGIHMTYLIEVVSQIGQYFTLNPHSLIFGFFCYPTASGKRIFDADREIQQLMALNSHSGEMLRGEKTHFESQFEIPILPPVGHPTFETFFINQE